MLKIKNRRDLTKRVKLSDVLPLKTPFTIYVDPSSACNFRCNFCYHCIDDQTLKKIKFEKTIMKMEVYEKVIKSIKQFPDRLKMLSLFIKGEPLLNRKLPEMVALAKAQKIAQKIYITTNGALFSPRQNRKLVRAGVDEILVSVEAVDSAEYKKITGIDVDFEEFVANIKDFFDHKEACNFFIKIVSYSLSPERIKRFHEIFDPICDLAYVEQVVPVFDRVDYDSISLESSSLKAIYRPIQVCTRPFFNMCVHSNGDIGPCLVDYVPEIRLGNIIEDRLCDVWRGKRFTDFRLMHLLKKRHEHFKCGGCLSPQFDTQDSDILDDNAQILLDAFRSESPVNPI